MGAQAMPFTTSYCAQSSSGGWQDFLLDLLRCREGEGKRRSVGKEEGLQELSPGRDIQGCRSWPGLRENSGLLELLPPTQRQLWGVSGTPDCEE